eukprot:3237453-Prymnesium_polylepis.1
MGARAAGSTRSRVGRRRLREGCGAGCGSRAAHEGGDDEDDLPREELCAHGRGGVAGAVGASARTRRMFDASGVSRARGRDD